MRDLLGLRCGCGSEASSDSGNDRIARIPEVGTDQPDAGDAEPTQQLADLTATHVGHAKKLSRVGGIDELRDGDESGHRDRATALSAVGLRVAKT